jgi:anionic cell wall polymer biosynthesis LytR-Cps2A-Psr (LCP) family protein
MDGFKDFINAIGGIRLNVNYRIPIGGQTDQGVKPDGYIEPGPDQLLNGRLALWYARGRYGLDDYKRMERQRCVINAVVAQSTPQAVLTNFQSILAAGEKTIQTDVPRSLLPALLDLGMKVKGTKLRSVAFTPGVAGFQSYDPNWTKVRSRVKAALKETAAGAESTPKPTPSATTATSSPSSTPSKKPKPRSDDLDAVCGYHPEKP